MNEPSHPREPDSSEEKSTRPALPRTKMFDLDSNTASFVCYIPVTPVNLILVVMFLCTEPKAHEFLRFHAMQSLVLSGGVFIFNVLCFVLSLAIAFLSFLGFLRPILDTLSIVVALAYIGVSIKLMIDAKKGRMESLPFVGDIAQQFM